MTFVPHLVPLDRGILETIYSRVTPGTTADDIAATLATAYQQRAVRAAHRRPPARDQACRPHEFLRYRVEARAGGERLVLVSVLDNLVKGAAGQAVQNFNLAYGLDEAAGLL